MKKSIFITIIYAIFTMIIILHHEIWADEAQVWLICKHLSVFELFKHLVNEGHPSLFYLLVMPFAKLSDNIFYQQLICYFSCVISIFLLWRYTNFSNLTKAVVTLSSPFIYHYPVIARNYSLIPLFIIVLALLHNKNEKHPVWYAIFIAMIANTHAIMFPFAALLGGYFIYKNIFIKKNRTKPFIIASIIMIFGFIALIAQLAGTTQSNVAINFENKGDLDTFIRVIMLFLFNSFDDYLIKANSVYFTKYSITMVVLTILTYISAFLFLFKQNKKIFLLAFLSIASHIAIYTFAYGVIFPTRIYCAYLIILFCFIVINTDKPKKTAEVILIVLFGLTFMNSLKSCFGDLKYDYTPSKKTAEYILKNINPDNSIIFISNPGYAAAVHYYLHPKINLYHITSGKPFKFVVWDKNCVDYYPEEFISSYFKFLRERGYKKDLYILIGFYPYNENKNMWYKPDGDFQLLYHRINSIFASEAFRLYKYKK